MASCSDPVTSSKFERRVLAGRHDLAFKVAFGTDGEAARFFGVSKMTIWRWRHDRSPLPESVLKVLPELLQERVAEAHLAQTEFGYFLREPLKPLRPLSGCCAGYRRRLKKWPMTPEDWAALGY